MPPGQHNQYRPYLCKWQRYRCYRVIVPQRPSLADGINFLAALFHSVAGYSAVNTARSALSSILPSYGGTTFGKTPLVSRLLKGVFELRPALPKYKTIWDVSLVLSTLENWELVNISLKDLSLKLAMLFALSTSQRIQTLKVLSVKNMTLTDSHCVFLIDSVLKTTRPGKHLTNIRLDAFTDNKNLCPVEHLKLYLNTTSKFRGPHTQLFLSYQKPHLPVSADTISRWIKTVMLKAGIDTKVFSAHSTRAASTSAAHKKGVPLDKIRATAGWSCQSTFTRFYHKPIMDTNTSTADSELTSS